MRMEVRVELKPGILDAEAEAVQKSLGLLGLREVRGVSTAKVYTLDLGEVSEEAAREVAQRAVDRLLANPIIHRVSIAPVRP